MMNELVGLARYGVIREKNKREIVLLKGRGCEWRKCTFCDYHLDSSLDSENNYSFNAKVLENVKGLFGKLEVINSGSFSDLDFNTIEEILRVCKIKDIRTLHFESHWINREQAKQYRSFFKEREIDVKIKTGIETFNADFRENVLKKGLSETAPEKIAEYFDECCLLFGISGQNLLSMIFDIETGLKYFERVCVNIMQANKSLIKPNDEVIKIFFNEVYGLFKENERVDILLNNTDFGVGGIINAQ